MAALEFYESDTSWENSIQQKYVASGALVDAMKRWTEATADGGIIIRYPHGDMDKVVAAVNTMITQAANEIQQQFSGLTLEDCKTAAEKVIMRGLVAKGLRISQHHGFLDKFGENISAKTRRRVFAALRDVSKVEDVFTR